MFSYLSNYYVYPRLAQTLQPLQIHSQPRAQKTINNLEKLYRKLLSGWIQARLSIMMLPFQQGGGTTLSASYGQSVTEPPAVDSRQTNKR